MKKSLFSNILFLFISFITISFLSGCEDSEKQLIEKYGGVNFEDCLSKYKFDGAYYFYSIEKEEYEKDNTAVGDWITDDGKKLIEKYHSLINAQVVYWSKEKMYENAFNVLQEFKIESNYNLNTDDEDANIPYNDEVSFYNNLLNDLINKMMIEKEPKETLLLYCKAIKTIAIGNVNDKNFFGSFNSYVLSDQPYKSALVKIK